MRGFMSTPNLKVMRAVPVENRREIVPNWQAVLLHTLGVEAFCPQPRTEIAIDPKTRGVQLVDEAVEVDGELVDGGGETTQVCIPARRCSR